ncbi:hypothetical protein [Lysinibacillus sp. SGAir0095]|uniref:hypothetical protein n=1 Tax=Lysinibacillus sp. SGAir0095 TaxID=2070463 RepID=UPI0010CCEDB0|nr:hypothetical protein [Lysinibacillus sp. SGAir0095]QCR31209.1 hypothetical protein C1N55_03115 [Lysinibacillus sp. SGAir0095]
MYYYYQPRYHPSPYNQIAAQPIVRASMVNHSPIYHQGAQHSNPMHPNYSQYIAQHNGLPQQRRQNQQPPNGSPYPPVDPELLYESAKQSNKLMKEASLVLDKLASSKEFGARLMDVAQHSNTQEVERLIHSVGITSDLKINYNPDGLELEFKSKVQNLDCCLLSISLRWR